MLYNFLNDDYKIDFPLPPALKELVEKAEKFDKENNYGMYLLYSEEIWVSAKNCTVTGELTKREWDILSARFL